MEQIPLRRRRGSAEVLRQQCRCSLNPVPLRIDKIVERGGKQLNRTGGSSAESRRGADADSIRAALQLRQAFMKRHAGARNLLFTESAEKQYEQTNALTQIGSKTAICQVPKATCAVRVFNINRPSCDQDSLRSGLSGCAQPAWCNCVRRRASDSDYGCADSGRPDRERFNTRADRRPPSSRCPARDYGALDDRPLRKGLAELREEV